MEATSLTEGGIYDICTATSAVRHVRAIRTSSKSVLSWHYDLRTRMGLGLIPPTPTRRVIPKRLSETTSRNLPNDATERSSLPSFSASCLRVTPIRAEPAVNLLLPPVNALQLEYSLLERTIEG